jgi:N-acetylglucosamine-6-phosphate deacetylase
VTVTLIAADRMIIGGDDGAHIVSPGYVRVVNGVIAEVGAGRPGLAHGSGPGPGSGSGNEADVTLTSGILAPGLIDLQVNGYYGHDLVDIDQDGWTTVVTRLPETGVTAFLPTFITAPVETLAEALSGAAKLDLPTGARVLGVHVEGPFLSERHPGAHNPAWLTDPTPDAIRTLLAARSAAPSGTVRLVLLTLAPERTGGLDAVRLLSEAGVVVSVGHSDATADQAAQAATAGARKVTHLFNAQTGIHHRAPGVAAQALADDRLTSGLIADLVHVSPVVCRIAFNAAPGRIVLVTDAAAAAGMPPGRYELGGEPIVLPASGPPLREDGTLAGSALRLDQAIGNIASLGIDLATAVDAATRIPADLIGRPDLGRIAPGAAADLVWLDDSGVAGFRARTTWISGKIVYQEESH